MFYIQSEYIKYPCPKEYCLNQIMSSDIGEAKGGV